MNRRNRYILFGAAALLILFFTGAATWWLYLRSPKPETKFDGQQAYQDVEYQMSLGPRVPDSAAHDQIVNWIAGELKKSGWEVEIQESVQMGHKVRNIVGKRGEGIPWIILGAHYDSRIYADQDPDPSKRTLPVPGANDGASGVAVLLEMARTLPQKLDKQVWLVFFDAEDNGNIAGWDWLLGSQAFVAQLKDKPDAAVIIDMIGDADQNIYLEKNSNLGLSTEIWSKAAGLGYANRFIPTPKYSMIDDHTPFLQAGIPAVDIIDFDYPYWHTTQDTADKVSAESLKVVGDTLHAWLDGYQ